VTELEERLVLLFTGGEPVDPGIEGLLPGADLVIAADSGLAAAVALGRRVDLVIGDLDSAEPAMVQAAESAGADVERHPVAKNETDLELGLVAALHRGATHVVVVGGYGGRLDHFLANALLLASPRFATTRIEAYMGAARVTVVRDRASLLGSVGDLVSLLAVGGPATGVRTEGLEYPLRGEQLDAGSTRGVSNVFAAPSAAVSLENGVLLAVQPRRGGS
jgi:thiamine pyrophosphokinase